ncbi:MAG: response regulator transcription factor [Planctomycetota bacterium]
MPLTVMIVEDHAVARIGIGHLLRSLGYDVAGAVATADEAVAMAEEKSPSVALLDVQLPQEDGLTVLEKLRAAAPELPVIVWSAYDNPTYIARAAALGAKDYLLKGGEVSQLRQSMQSAIDGDDDADHGLLGRVRRTMWEVVDVNTLPDGFPLTSREAQVLRHIALGLSNKEIAKSLSISVETVKEHFQNILRKTKATDRTAAAVRAIKSGMVE